MPSTPKPKQFVAVRNFTHAWQRFEKGQPIEDRRLIALLLHYGDRFIKVNRTKSPAVDTATTPQADQSTEED